MSTDPVLPNSSGADSTGIRCEFRDIRRLLDEEQDVRALIRTAVKDLQDQTKEAIALLQGVHQSTANIPRLVQEARCRLPKLQTSLKQVVAAFPPDLYHRFRDQWTNALQNLAFLGAFIHYLEFGSLIRRNELAEMFAISVSADAGFHISLEDMLLGMLELAAELSRLAVNSVIHGDMQRPVDIAAFMNQLNSAFQLLNLKNDQLRRRYDGLKYNVKKVEEVIYDLAIRGLKPSESQPEEQPVAMAEA